MMFYSSYLNIFEFLTNNKYYNIKSAQIIKISNYKLLHKCLSLNLYVPIKFYNYSQN